MNILERNIMKYDLSVTAVPESAAINVTMTEEYGAEIYRIEVSADEPVTGLRLSFHIPAGDIAGRWFPRMKMFDKGVHNSWESPVWTTYTGGAPIVSFYRSDDRNRLTAALSDCMASWSLKTGVDDRTKCLEFIAETNDIRMSADTGKYAVSLFIDASTEGTSPTGSKLSDMTTMEPRPERCYWESLRAVSDFMESFYPSRRLPDSAFDPVFSTWYSFQRGIFADKVLRQCREAYSLGCRTVFLDDGWQTIPGIEDYSYAGDWVPDKDKFPDMKGFVDSVHAIGMRVILWIAPGLCGNASKLNNLYGDKKIPGGWVLDPRFPEVRARMVEDVCRVARSYGFDGLKIDFLDSFQGADIKPENADGRDYLSVTDALDDMIRLISVRLAEISPDFLTEYRQNYTGPAVLSTANMVRVADCPQDYTTNRVGTIDLRLHTHAAVHSDMVQFDPGEPVEISALQIVNILFGTPQISVMFDQISEEQRRMLKFWLGFMSDKRELLQKSILEPHRCEANYTYVTAKNDAEELHAMYSERLLMLDDPKKRIYVVNAVDRLPLYICLRDGRADARYQIFDCTGKKIKESDMTLTDTPAKLDIPMCGMAVIDQE